MSFRSGCQWTPEEDEILLRMLAAGEGPTAISRVLEKRTFEAVQGRRRTITGTWGRGDRKVPPPPVGIRIKQLIESIEKAKAKKAPPDLLRAYRLSLINMRWQERQA